MMPLTLRCNLMLKESILVFLSKPLVKREGYNQGTNFSRNNERCASHDLSRMRRHLVGAVLGRRVAHISEYFSTTIENGG
jgi:hypothetical protein